MVNLVRETDPCRKGPTLASLFVLGLPRSLSTHVYHVARRSLGLAAPSWVMDGEILNVDRMASYLGPRVDECAKFTTEDAEPALFRQVTEFLDQVAHRDGFIYKDVIQPFVVAAWVGLSDFRVLRLKRPLTDIAYSMLHRGWYYPAAAALSDPIRVSASYRQRQQSSAVRWPFRKDREQVRLERLVVSLVDGLVRADRCLDQIDATVVHYDDIVTRGPTVIHHALQELYPEIDVASCDRTDRAFAETSTVFLRRRDSPAYRELAEFVQDYERKSMSAQTSIAPATSNGANAQTR